MVSRKVLDKAVLWGGDKESSHSKVAYTILSFEKRYVTSKNKCDN